LTQSARGAQRYYIDMELITVTTRQRQELVDITAQVNAIIAASGVTEGLCHLWCNHTTAALTVNENADPDVMRDMEAFMARQVPDGDPLFTHTAEGPDDMPAHVRSVLTQSDLNLPVQDGRCALGTWQGIYLWEHRLAPHTRRVILTIHGE